MLYFDLIDLVCKDALRHGYRCWSDCEDFANLYKFAKLTNRLGSLYYDLDEHMLSLC